MPKKIDLKNDYTHDVKRCQLDNFDVRKNRLFICYIKINSATQS